MIKNFFKQIAPPFLIPFARSVLYLFKPVSPIYEGLFLSRDQLPHVASNPFEHVNWTTYVRDSAAGRMTGVTAQNMHEMCLSLISSLISQDETFNVRRTVVDFGGGVGMYWPTLKTQNKCELLTDFVVVDSPSNCEIGSKLFNADGVKFYVDLEKVLIDYSNIHILNVASTLQYCLDYEAILNLLCSSNANFIIISRHPSPNNDRPVAYTIQNVTTIKGFCGQIQTLLLSVQTLTNLMRENGYRLIADYFDNTGANKYWGKHVKKISKNYSLITEHALVFQKNNYKY
jgi:putative methyltransferase (TIGR04325 family)